MERVKISEIREGDTYLAMPRGDRVWTAVSDAEHLPTGDYRIRVQFCNDGGIEDRRWSSLSGEMTLPMERANA